MVQVGLRFPFSCDFQIGSGGVAGLEEERSGIVYITNHGNGGWSMGNFQPVTVLHYHVRKIAQVFIFRLYRKGDPPTGAGIAKLRDDRLLSRQHLRKISRTAGSRRRDSP